MLLILCQNGSWFLWGVETRKSLIASSNEQYVRTAVDSFEGLKPSVISQPLYKTLCQNGSWFLWGVETLLNHRLWPSTGVRTAVDSFEGLKLVYSTPHPSQGSGQNGSWFLWGVETKSGALLIGWELRQNGSWFLWGVETIWLNQLPIPFANVRTAVDSFEGLKLSSHDRDLPPRTVSERQLIPLRGWNKSGSFP